MKLIVYKGFNQKFLEELNKEPLVEGSISDKIDVTKFNKKTKKMLNMSLISLENDEEAWITYEEYSLIKSAVEEAIDEDGLEVIVYKNNLYPDYYPLLFELEEEVINEIDNVLNGNDQQDISEKCQKYLSVYNSLVKVDDVLYGSFYNYEYDKDKEIKIVDYYPNDLMIEEGKGNGDYDVFLNGDVETYLRDLHRIFALKPEIVGLRTIDASVSTRIQKSLQAYCLANGIRLTKFYERLPEDVQLEQELIDIAKQDIRIEGFQNFRTIKFYKNPDFDKEVVELSQAQLIQEIIRQAERSYNKENGENFRDIFITASTGAGKSVMFQIPAIYLAKKYHKLTIIIEPVKALMQDQKEKLNRNGFLRVEAFNSDLISQVEKEAVLERIKSGQVDLLYLSPETLLSYSIETIIGEREIGLLIIDEAHIVTTWGVGFRPDYWYLGGYINRLRNQIQLSRDQKRKVYNFPICAFTATAINGGIDDSVSDTIISLYMENPIKYIGYVRRDDIDFDISCKRNGEKLPKAEYEEEKAKDFSKRIDHWLKTNEKTVVYFPYASLAGDALKGVKSFAGITKSEKIGIYTGRNIDALSNEAFNEKKRETFEKFRNGTTSIMLATKAFGMGVDVNDVRNVYHYAVTGNLCDYVQEIGRAARKTDMEGVAITDNYYNDITFMKVLFGMSQIKQYQIKKVLEGIYSTYKNKKNQKSFLISPESFTYIFNAKDEGTCINQLKTCLLMIEKDFYDKYNYKVLVSRPQSVFTKAYVCINRDHQKDVLNSKYGKCFKFIEKGRYKELQRDGSLLSDNGDIYSIDLKKIWEEFHPNISFPQFKYWYFNSSSHAKDKVNIMPSIREYITPRQRVSVEARGELLIEELRDKILQDFEYIADKLYSEMRNKYFSTEDFAKLIKERYGITQARIIANSLFQLVDPNGVCVKHRANETSGKTYYSLAHGNFKEFMRKPIIKSRIISNFTRTEGTATYSGFMSLVTDESSNIALKLLSVFDYITYEISGGEEPEIFIRLNDPNKVKDIVLGNIFYSNNYVSKAKQKHDRDVSVLLRFFNELHTKKERWDYIENYFLGYDVLCGGIEQEQTIEKMARFVDKEHSYATDMYRSWNDLISFFDDAEHIIINKFIENGIPLAEYLETTLKKTDAGSDIVMSWPSKDTLICQQDTTANVVEYFESKGWNVYKVYDIDYQKIKKELS